MQALLAASVLLSATQSFQKDLDTVLSSDSFLSRSVAYGRLQDVIQTGQSESGFVGAARDVTLVFSAGMGVDQAREYLPSPYSAFPIFRPATQKFMPILSKDLATLNSPLIKQLIESGQIQGMSGAVLDDWWVEQEQRQVERLLSKLPADSRATVVGDMNAALFMASGLSDVASLLRPEGFAPLRAAGFSRAMLEEAEGRRPDYGFLQDRILIGQLTAMLNRRNDRLIPIQQKSEVVFQVRAGESIVFSAGGRMNPNANGLVCGPDGIEAARFRPVFNPPLASENFGCLLGEIRPSKGRSQLFKIGRGGTLNVPISGELRLLVNDNITADNEGLFLVQVKRE